MSPITPKAMPGIHAATSGEMMPFDPNPFVSCTERRNTTVVPRLTATPYAAPPRWLLVASGAPNSAMMMHAAGIAIFSMRSTLSVFTSVPDRSAARMNRESSA